jgi:hypothetical protein
MSDAVEEGWLGSELHTTSTTTLPDSPSHGPCDADFDGDADAVAETEERKLEGAWNEDDNKDCERARAQEEDAEGKDGGTDGVAAVVVPKLALGPASGGSSGGGGGSGAVPARFLVPALQLDDGIMSSRAEYEGSSRTPAPVLVPSLDVAACQRVAEAALPALGATGPDGGSGASGSGIGSGLVSLGPFRPSTSGGTGSCSAGVGTPRGLADAPLPSLGRFTPSLEGDHRLAMSPITTRQSGSSMPVR